MSQPLPSRPLLLADLPDGAPAIVERLVPQSAVVDEASLRRLGDVGFIPGEPVKVVRRGPGGREPLAVLIGQTMFALRLAEAACVEVSLT